MVGIEGGHNAAIDVKRLWFHHPAPGHVGAAVAGNFEGGTGNFAQHGEVQIFADGGIHLATEALDGFIRPDPLAATDVHEIEAGGRFADDDVFTGCAHKLVIGVFDTGQHNRLIGGVSFLCALHRIDRGEHLGDKLAPLLQFIPFGNAELGIFLAQLFLIVEVSHHGRGNLLVVALAHHERGACAVIESQHGRVLRVGLHERLNAVKRFVLVAEKGVGIAAGALHFGLKLLQVVIGKVYFFLAGGLGSCHCAETQRQQGQNSKNGFFKHMFVSCV